MALMLNRQLRRMFHQVHGLSAERLALSAAVVSAGISCGCLHTRKMHRVNVLSGARHNYSEDIHAKQFLLSESGLNHCQQSVQRCMWTWNEETSWTNHRVNQPSGKARLCLDNSVVGEELLTSLDVEPMSVHECCSRLEAVFQTCDVSEPHQSAQYLIAHTLGRKTLHGVDPLTVLSVSQLQDLTTLSSRRLTGWPIQYVLGEWDFRDLTLQMAPPVFIPRPETEELVSHVLDDPVVKNGERFIEVGCGSGAICLALLSERPQLSGVALERSAAACQLTTQNARTVGVEHRLELLHRTLEPGTFQEKAFHKEFDFLVSNPPYIKTADMDRLQAEVADFEDHDALHGGDDGLNVIRIILQGAAHILKPNGSVWLEVDSGHPPLIQTFVEDDHSLGLTYEKTYTDFRGMPRFCHLRRTST